LKYPEHLFLLWFRLKQLKNNIYSNVYGIIRY
jgi:hypothetical protein